MRPLPVWFYELVVAPGVLTAAAVHAARTLGLRQAAVELGALVAYGFALEKTAMALFESHRYSVAWRVAPAGVPIAVAAVWGALILAGLAAAGRRGLASPLARAAAAAAWGIALDLLMEPVAVRGGLWEWTPSGPWLGVPVGNFVGWAVIVGAYALGAEVWTTVSPLLSQVLRRAALAAAAIALLVLVGLAWRGTGAETAFQGRVGWCAWAALLAAAIALPHARRTALPAKTLSARLGARNVRLANVVFWGVALTFTYDAAALGGRALAAVAAGTLAVLVVTLPDTVSARLAARWRTASMAALAEVEGLIHVLMKPRNGQPWTLEDRRFLKDELRTLARWTPALVLFLLPGTFALLPAYAWLLDRRRGLRPTAAGTGS